MEFGAPVWATGHHVNLHPLEQVQRLSLLRITGCLRSTSTAAVEVLTGIMPLRLRIQEVCIQELIRIAGKPDDHPLKKIFCLDDTTKSRSKAQTPAHSLWRMISNLDKDIDITLVEPDIQYNRSYNLKMPILPKLIGWEGLGCAGTKTVDQTNRAYNIATEHIADLDGVIAFTDGSATPNPGPTGAGAALQLDGTLSKPVLLSKAVSKHSSSYMGELEAVNLALEYLVNCSRLFNRVCILTDCQSALTAILSDDQNNRCHTINTTQELATQLSSKGTNICITWIAGHIGLFGNDLADQLAKEGVAEAAKSNITRLYVQRKL
jgi:ribonuclease HI